MPGGARLDGRRRHVEESHGLVVAECVALDYLHRLQLFQTGFFADLVLTLVSVVLKMAHVGDIPNVANFVAEVAKELEQHVIGDTRTGMAEMRVSVHGGSADVHPDMSLVDRNEKFLVPG